MTRPKLKIDLDFFRDVAKSAETTTAAQRLAAQISFAALRYKEARTPEDDLRVLDVGSRCPEAMLGLGYAAMPDDILAESCRVCAEPYTK